MTLFISINAASKALEKSAIDHAITRLAARATMAKREGRLPFGPALDITFMLPVAGDAPPFSGMRMGGYTEQNQTLFFEAVVPERMIHSNDAPQYVSLLMRDVIDNAWEYFDETGVLFNAEAWYRSMAELASEGTASLTPPAASPLLI